MTYKGYSTELMTEEELNKRYPGFDADFVKRALSIEVFPLIIGPLYATVNAMMAQLRCDGFISDRDPLVDDVMNALHDIDGGKSGVIPNDKCEGKTNG